MTPTAWVTAHAVGLVPLAAIVLVLIGVIVVAYALLAPPSTSTQQQRVDAIAGYLPGAPGAHAAAPTPSGSSPVASLVAASERIAQNRKNVNKTLMLIHRADLPLTPGEWLAIKVGAGFGLMVLGRLLTGNLLLLVLFLAAAIFLPGLVLKFLAKRRQNKFEKQLPDVLMLIATSLGSGFGLPQAFDAVVQDAAEPLAKEFSRAQAETRLGGQLVDALERVGERMGSTSLGWAVMAMRIQAEVGGNLAETLRTTAQTLRDRERLLGQVRALSAEGRLSAYVLVAMPIGLFLYLMMVNYEYISLLWTTFLGVIMMTLGIVALVLGITWMNKLVKIEV